VRSVKRAERNSYVVGAAGADVHHNGMKIALEVAQHVDKVRITSRGLYVFDKPRSQAHRVSPLRKWRDSGRAFRALERW